MSRTTAFLCCLSLSVACSPQGSGPPISAQPRPVTVAAPAPASEPVTGIPLIVYLGDSLTAGYGLDEAQAFPARVAERLTAEGTLQRTVNAGVSGDTTAAGLARVDWVLEQHPAVLVVGLGGNDGLRGLPLAETERNLREIVKKGQAAGARVILLGMKIPPSYGADYVAGFEALYPRLARELGVALVPFLLEGVAGKPELNLPDGIHPTAAGHEILAATVTPAVRAALQGLDER
jgi:acyl-CoA thioesterase-1